MSITDTISQNQTFGLINTKDITIDENGQRDVNRRRAQFNRIMKSFDPRKVNPPKVAVIDSKYYCFDGQMTLKVLKAKNKGKDLDVMCSIYTGLTLMDAADLFCAQRTDVSPVTPADIIRVKAAWGDQSCLGFMRATEKAGIDIAWNYQKGKDTITCVSTAYHCYLRFKDPNKYTVMLKVMKDAWSGLEHALDAKLVRGMTEFFCAYENIDAIRLTKKLAMTRPMEIIRDAQIDRTYGDRKYAVIILQLYNKGARDNMRLPNCL